MPPGWTSLLPLPAVAAAVLLLRRLDAHDARTILAARLLFALHAAFFCLLSAISVRAIVRAHDRRRSPTAPGAAGDAARSQTVHEHDLRALERRTRAWALNALVLCGVHVRANTLVPLVVAATVGSAAVWMDDITRVHVRGMRPRARPWGEGAGTISGIMAAVREAGAGK